MASMLSLVGVGHTGNVGDWYVQQHVQPLLQGLLLVGGQLPSYLLYFCPPDLIY